MLEGRPAGEVACPEGVRPVGVRKEVVCFDGPRHIGLVECVQVAGRRRVEYVDVAGVCRLPPVDVLDKLVEVFVPHVGVGVLEVRAHRHYKVVGLVLVALAVCVVDEVVYFLVDVVFVE